MTLQAAIDKLLREQADRTDLIETLWLMYAAHVKIPTGGVQWIESRRCFFAGATTIFEAFMRIMEPGEEPTEADLRRVDRIANELDRYREELSGGTA